MADCSSTGSLKKQSISSSQFSQEESETENTFYGINKNSEFFSEYRNFMNKECPLKEEIYKALKYGGFTKRDAWQSSIRSIIIDTDMQTMLVDLHYGELVLQVTILNTSIPDNFRKQKIAAGSYGIVYQIQHNGRIFVVKEISIDQKSDKITPSNLEKVLKEYFMTKIASTLKIGPEVICPFGYDIVIMNKKVFFCLEKCQQSLNNRKINIQRKLQKLYQSLSILHSINFVHCDIKPENVVWSPSFKKYVMIDFGLSMILKQKTGEKTLTKYFGTYAYCSEQMKKLLFKEKSYIDLYYNDLHGLNKTLQSFNQETKVKDLVRKVMGKGDSHDSIQNSVKKCQLSEAISIFRLKYALFFNNFEMVLIIVKNQTKMLKTCLQICKNNPKISQLKQPYKKKFSDISYQLLSQLTKLKFETSNTDNLLCFYHKKLYYDNSLSNIFPIDFLLKLKNNEFKAFLSNDIWLQRIFMLLYPKFYGNSIENYYQNAKKVIQKIYACLQKQNKKQPFPSKKVKKVLLMFKQRFIEMKNVEYLFYLSQFFRYLFDNWNLNLTLESMLEIADKDNQSLYYFSSVYIFLISQPFDYIHYPLLNIEMIKIVYDRGNITCLHCLQKQKGCDQIGCFIIAYNISSFFLQISENPFKQIDFQTRYGEIIQEMNKFMLYLPNTYKTHIELMKQRMIILKYNHILMVKYQNQPQNSVYRKKREQLIESFQNYFRPMYSLLMTNKPELLARLRVSNNIQQIRQICSQFFKQNQQKTAYISCCFWKSVTSKKKHMALPLAHILLDFMINCTKSRLGSLKTASLSQITSNLLRISDILMIFYFYKVDNQWLKALQKFRFLLQIYRKKAEYLDDQLQKEVIYQSLQILSILVEGDPPFNIDHMVKTLCQRVQNSEIIIINRKTIFSILIHFRKDLPKFCSHEISNENYQLLNKTIMKFYFSDNNHQMITGVDGAVLEIASIILHEGKYELLLQCTLKYVRMVNYSRKSCYGKSIQQSVMVLLKVLTGIEGQEGFFKRALARFAQIQRIKFIQLKNMLEISPLIFCIIAKAYPHGEKAHFERLMKVVAFGTSQSCYRNLIILKLDYFDHFKTIFSVNKRKLLNLERRSHISNGKDKLRQTILQMFPQKSLVVYNRFKKYAMKIERDYCKISLKK